MSIQQLPKMTTLHFVICIKVGLTKTNFVFVLWSIKTFYYYFQVIDYKEENSESEILVPAERNRRITKSINYLEENSEDSTILVPIRRRRRKNINYNLDESNEAIPSRRKPRKKFQLNTYCLKRPYKKRYIKKNEILVSDLDERSFRRKYLKRSDVLTANLDETAQDGSVMGEIAKKKRRMDAIDYNEDLEISKDGTSRDSLSISCDSECKRRRKRTCAEVFIEENQKYFKFEAPGSRLR